MEVLFYEIRLKIWAALSAFRSRFFAYASLRQKELRSSRAAKNSLQSKNPQDSISIAVGKTYG